MLGSIEKAPAANRRSSCDAVVEHLYDLWAQNASESTPDSSSFYLWSELGLTKAKTDRIYNTAPNSCAIDAFDSFLRRKPSNSTTSFKFTLTKRKLQ